MLDHELPGRKSDKSYAGAMVRYFMAVVVLELMFVTGYIWFNINSLADLAPIFTDREELINFALPFIFAMLFVNLPNVLSCRPPDDSKISNQRSATAL